MRALALALACLSLSVAVAGRGSQIDDAVILAAENPPALSSFGFFQGGPDRPAPALMPYSLRTPLFSDYAEKQRFLYLPPGRTYTLGADGGLHFPVGSVLIKSFGYADAAGKLRIIETRLLLHRADGWVALPYVWRADGSDADLKLGGTRQQVAFTKPDGSRMAISYAVPNKNQCKQCHASKDAVVPVGPVWHNMQFANKADQARFAAKGEPAPSRQPIEPKWDEPASGSVEARALAYLRVNCAHCHKPTGSASNSGLFYDDPGRGAAALGIGKRPVAAGRGSGGHAFVIDPGHPERSILIYRMRSTDPGIAMPEVGRATAHDEGIALLSAWIKGMKPG